MQQLMSGVQSLNLSLTSSLVRTNDCSSSTKSLSIVSCEDMEASLEKLGETFDEKVDVWTKLEKHAADRFGENKRITEFKKKPVDTTLE